MTYDPEIVNEEWEEAQADEAVDDELVYRSERRSPLVRVVLLLFILVLIAAVLVYGILPYLKQLLTAPPPPLLPPVNT